MALQHTLDTGNSSRSSGLLSSFLGLVGLKHGNSLIHLKTTDYINTNNNQLDLYPTYFSRDQPTASPHHQAFSHSYTSALALEERWVSQGRDRMNCGERVEQCKDIEMCAMLNRVTAKTLTLERSDSGDSSMWSSSELSISSSIPVILPARLGCMFWIKGNRRSPGVKVKH